MMHSRYAPNLKVVAGLAAVYLVAAKLGLMLAFVHASATAVWPPAGIALAAVLVFGYRFWLGIFVGAFLANIATAGSIAIALAIAAGNTLEGVTGAYLVTRFAGGTRAFDRPQDVFRFALLAGAISTMVGPTVGLASLALGGFGPFARETPHESLLLLQGFVGFTALLAMAFAALVAERNRIEAKREALLRELDDAFVHIKALRGLLPMCASCKKIRDDQGYWDYVENYIQTHSEATITHGLCPDCIKKLYPQLEKQPQ